MGGVKPGRDQATCEGGGCALLRNGAARGFTGSLALVSLAASVVDGGGAELFRSSADRGFADASFGTVEDCTELV